MGLAREIVGAGLDALERARFAGRAKVTSTTGRSAVAGVCRMRRQTSYPERPGIMTSSSTMSGMLRRELRQRLLADCAASTSIPVDHEQVGQAA